jgi:hypothetical protein
MHINTNVRFDVFTAVTMRNGVFWDVTPCGSCKNRHGFTSHKMAFFIVTAVEYLKILRSIKWLGSVVET